MMSRASLAEGIMIARSTKLGALPRTEGEQTLSGLEAPVAILAV